MKIKHFFYILVLVAFASSCEKSKTQEPDHTTEPPTKPIVSSYDETVLKDKPVGYWLVKHKDVEDLSDKKVKGAFHGTLPISGQLPNLETANVFNGENAYFEIPDVAHLEVTKTGILTIEAWMRPDVLDFPKSQKGYVHWMGKGVNGQHSWVARMYNKSGNDRPQRISGYSFNLTGGLGAGSYFQDNIPKGTWVHYVLVINTKNTDTKYPTGYTKVYKDGKRRDQDSLKDYDIIPGDGTAPTRIATRDFNSFFKGAIAKVAFYDYELEAAKIEEHNKIMRSK